MPFAVQRLRIKTDNVLIFDFGENLFAKPIKQEAILNGIFDILPAARFADFGERGSIKLFRFKNVECLPAPISENIVIGKQTAVIIAERYQPFSV